MKPLLIGSLPLSSPRDQRETLAVVDIGAGEPWFAKTGKWVLWPPENPWVVGSVLYVDFGVGAG